MSSASVAVVGAGLAGLSAALELKRRGHEVLLFERGRLLGGKATSFTVDGIEVDNGQHVVLACCTQFAAFVESVGMGDVLRLQDRFEALVLDRDGRSSRLRAAPLPAPLHLAASFAAYRHLTPVAKLQVAWALAQARRNRAVAASETFAGWLTRQRQGAVARRAFWDLFMVPAFNAALEDVSAADGLFVIRTAFLGDAGAARFGFTTVPLARLAEAAARRCDAVNLRAPVAGVVVEDRRLRALVLEDGHRVEVDAAVLAVPPRRLGRILEDAPAAGVAGLEHFRTEPIVDVHLWYERDVAVDFSFAAILGSPVQWVFVKGPGYLCCSLSSAAQHVGRPEADLVALCHRELARAIPSLRGLEPRRGAATRDPEATFVCAPGLRRPGPTTAVGNLAIAGAWTDTGWPATMESAVRSGRAAAAVLTPIQEVAGVA